MNLIPEYFSIIEVISFTAVSIVILLFFILAKPSSGNGSGWFNGNGFSDFFGGDSSGGGFSGGGFSGGGFSGGGGSSGGGGCSGDF